MSSKVIVIGAGFSGLSAASHLARLGFKVEVLEKNSLPGGRSRKLEVDGFTFDMGATWYLMPEIYQHYFSKFNKRISSFYKLKRPKPAFRLYLDENVKLDIPVELEKLYAEFEKFEPGSSKKLEYLLQKNHKKYNKAIRSVFSELNDSIFKYLNPSYYFTPSCYKASRISDHIKFFKNSKLKKILEFPEIFLGPSRFKIPAFYSLMNNSRSGLGLWYPVGGMHKIIESLEKICYNLNVEITYNTNVDQLDIIKGRVQSAHARNQNFYAEYFVSSADYAYTDQKLIPDKYNNYSQSFWNKRNLSPYTLIFYIGLNKKIPQLKHHNFLLDTDLKAHSNEIYSNRNWPQSPAIYISCPSKTDSSVAPEGCENLVAIIPVAPELEDHGKVREHYYDLLIRRLEKNIKTDIRSHVVFQKSYAHSDFSHDYNAYKGNSFGLHTGCVKPSLVNKKLPNLFYTGQSSYFGSGIPLALINGEIIANYIFKASGGHKS